MRLHRTRLKTIYYIQIFKHAVTITITVTVTVTATYDMPHESQGGVGYRYLHQGHTPLLRPCNELDQLVSFFGEEAVITGPRQSAQGTSPRETDHMMQRLRVIHGTFLVLIKQ